MSDQLIQVAQSGDQWAAERANYAMQVHQAVTAGQMSASEAKEILQDMINTQQLQEQANADHVKAALFFGIMELISFYA
jgi:polyhydroxyalkanoate synthesis regulator phasin